MNEREEKIYLRGEEAAFRMILGECVRHLRPGEDRKVAQLEKDLSEARAALHALCDRYGLDDGGWSRSSNLSDMVEDLSNQLSERIEEA